MNSGSYKKAKFGHNGGENAKLSALRPITRSLQHCQYINRWKNGFQNKKILKMYIIWQKWVIGALKAAKRTTFGQNEGQKTKSSILRLIFHLEH